MHGVELYCGRCGRLMIVICQSRKLIFIFQLSWSIQLQKVTEWSCGVQLLGPSSMHKFNCNAYLLIGLSISVTTLNYGLYNLTVRQLWSQA